MQDDRDPLDHSSSGLGDDAARIEAEFGIEAPSHDPFSAAVHATRMPMVVTNPRLPDNPIVFVNDAFCRMTGYPREEILGRNCRFLQGPGTSRAPVDEIRAAIREVRSIEIDIRNYRRDGTPFWNRLLLAPVHDEAGQLTYFFASQLDVTLERERLADLEAQNTRLVAERRLVADRLAFSEASLGLAIDAAEIGTWDLDLLTGVLNWSVRTKAMFGISATVDCDMDDFYAGLHPDDRDATSAAFASALNADTRAVYDVEYRTIGKEDGIVRWVSAKGRGIFDEHGQCVRALGTAIDITGRKEIEQRLRASEARLLDLNATLEQRVAESTAERDRMWRLSTDLMLVARFDATIAAINPAWTALLGWSSDELVGRPFLDFIHPDDVAQTVAETAGLAAGRSTMRFENRYRRPDGGYRWLSWSAVPEGGLIHAVARDITVEKAALDELERSRAQARSVFETSYSLQGLLSLRGDVLDANTTALNAIRATRDEVVGRPFWQTSWFARTPAMAATVREAVHRVARGDTFQKETMFDLPIGERALDFSMRPVRAPTGTVITILFEAIDVTERRSAEEALRQAQKMDAVGQLTGGVAHDFNNLLTVIRSAADFLRRSDLSDDKRRRYIDAISDTADRGAKLTGQLLAFARRQPLKPEIFAINDKVAGVAEMMRSLLGSRIRLNVETPSQSVCAEADIAQFETAILNLAVNARDAMDGEGQLTLKVTPADAIPAVRQHPERPGNFVAISVTDTGEGIAADRIDRIFEPFFTTKAVGKGTGLGLSQVFGFAKQSGGDVCVESEPGVGTTFAIYLRVVEPKADRAAIAPAPEVESRRDSACILVVEDNQQVGDFATSLLEDLGYQTVWASDGQSALDLLARADTHFDVVFTDVIMPGMSGIELGEEIRRLYPRLPVILTSGYSTVLAEKGRHGFELLQKPYSVEAMSRVLRRAVRDRSSPCSA